MKIIIEERRLPDGVTAEDLRVRLEALRRTGDLISVRVENRGDGAVQVIVRPSFSDTIKLHLQGTTPAKFFAEKDIDRLIADFESDRSLGVLSAKYESNGNPAAIGYDDAGGHSYGAYQFASRLGTVGSFIEFLSHVKEEFSQALLNAGGEAKAMSGDDEFKNAWISLADDPEFWSYQHAFVKSRYYDPIEVELAKKFELELKERSFALQNVAWSTAVQHGVAGGRNIFLNAASANDITASAADEEIIKSVYDERSKVDTYFSKVPSLHDSLRQRFADEKTDALAMLA